MPAIKDFVNVRELTEHIDTSIRLSIQSRLASLVTHVYGSRLDKIPSKNLPVIAIYTTSDTADKSRDEANYKRSSIVNIVLYVDGQDASRVQASEKSVDIKLDDLRLKVEQELFNQYETLNKLIYRLDYLNQNTVKEDNADKLTLICVMQFIAIYHQAIKPGT